MKRSNPQRLCVVCRGRRSKEDLLRFARTGAGTSLAPAGEYRPGRGSYLCSACIDQAQRRGIRDRSLRLTPAEVRKMIIGLDQEHPWATAASKSAAAAAAKSPPARAAERPEYRRRLLGLLGLAQRARRVRIGRDEALRAIRRGEAALVVLASDVGSDLGGAVEKTLRDSRRPGWISGPTKSELGQALGRRPVGVVALTDEGFARAIEKPVGPEAEVDSRKSRLNSESG